MGVIHVHNKLDKPIYVVVAPNSDWVVADIVASLASAGFSLAKGISTIPQLWRAIHLARAAGSAGGALLKVRDFFREKGIRVHSRGTEKVFNTDWDDPFHYLSYLGPSAWAALCGASVKSLMIAEIPDGENAELGRMAQFNSPDDDSWIATERAVVRAKHGRLAVESPDEGLYPWDRGLIVDTREEAIKYAEASADASDVVYCNKIIIANDSGHPLDLVTTHSWTGSFVHSVPARLPNGMFAVVLHGTTRGTEDSAGALVLRQQHAKMDILCGFFTRYDIMYRNKTYVAIRGTDHWWRRQSKDALYDDIDDSDYDSHVRTGPLSVSGHLPTGGRVLTTFNVGRG